MLSTPSLKFAGVAAFISAQNTKHETLLSERGKRASFLRLEAAFSRVLAIVLAALARQLLCFFMPDTERRQLQASRRAQCARWRLPARDLPQQVGGDNADAHGAGALASGRVYLPDEHGWQKRLSWSSTMGFAHVAFRDAATFTWPQGQCLQACVNDKPAAAPRSVVFASLL